MAILKVASLGHPILRQVTLPVPRDHIGHPAFQQFLDDLVDTMREYDGVGIAANQVHSPLRVFAMECQGNRRYPSAPAVPLQIVINPEVEFLSAAPDTVDEWEGCLSVPGLRGEVPRRHALRMRALDRTGAPFDVTLEGFAARIVQHEIDHLNGRVYLDCMNGLQTLSYEKEYKRFHRRSG
jgi:peptide deformylase